ncbi:unnamed protein product [Clavelina lepadiformis]|uniref:Uncharacterized protein n=1 Tax=Clavelina lepadiformis TaxID=159417 RepID=A0ABP0GED1_CLALP
MFCADKVNNNFIIEPRLIFIESCRGGFPAFQRWFTDAIAGYFSQHAKDTETMPFLTKEMHSLVKKFATRPDDADKVSVKPDDILTQLREKNVLSAVSMWNHGDVSMTSSDGNNFGDFGNVASMFIE